MNKFKLDAAGLAAALLLTLGVAQASGINGINNGMPNRISMNVTVAKQTQGATFGEKVSSGLQSGANAVAQGALLAVVVECGQVACAMVFPDNSGYRADLQAMTLAPLAAEQGATLRSGTLTQGASLLGGALPGGSIVSAAVSSVGGMGKPGGMTSSSYAAGRSDLVSAAASGIGGMGKPGGATSSSYARSAQPAEVPVPLRSANAGDGRIDVLDPLQDGDYALTLVVEKATSGLKDTLKTNVRTAAPQQVRIVVGFSVEAGVLKTRHDTAKNSIGNIR